MTTADNQQERLRFIGWIIGFTDGEGCFTVSIFRNNTTKSGYQVFPEFVITQGEKSRNALEKIQKFFQCGKIYINRRYDNHREHIYRYCVRSLVDLQNVIIPFFQNNKLVTGKKKDFEYFVQAVRLIGHKKHLTQKGLSRIAILKSKLNRKILRDYTSDFSKGEKKI